MGENTGIEWCDHTFNPWVGCQEVSPACDHCYAREFMTRKPRWANAWSGQRFRTSDSNWNQPLKWDRLAGEAGVRRRVFCASLADVFDNQVDPTWRADLWDLIQHTDNLDWLLLTKRPQNIAKMLPGNCGWSNPDWPWPNVWLGTTVENQEEADRRIPHLLAVPAKVHFLSCEPLLGPIDLRVVYRDKTMTDALEGISESGVIDAGDRMVAVNPIYRRHAKINWVIAGGESGPGARPMNLAWARSLRDQCAAASVPFLFKQWGDWSPDPGYYAVPLLERPDLHHWADMPVSVPFSYSERIGKKRAGKRLDGREHLEFPR